ncbi:MAG: efflux RND transporter periplasmic adaptor subunit [Gammaproteobacteria bacterium]|nr:efflux RND transporter periplasmic adaptor subunit [Gammaproteobacteria bacterium]
MLLSALLLSGCQADIGGLTDRLRAGIDSLLGIEPEAPADKPRRPGRADHLVEADRVKVENLRATAVYTGSLAYRQRVRIFTQEEGRIIRLPFYEGDRVERGEVLLALDDALLAAELRKARAVSAEARANLARIQRLRQRNMVAEDEFVRARTAVEVASSEESMLQTRLGYTEVEASFDGVIAERLVEAGDVVVRHAHVMTLIDPSSLVSELQVSEILLPHIRIGDAVQVRIDALGDRALPGRVLRIHPEIDPQTRHGLVEVELKPVPAGARAGQFARVHFETEALGRKVIAFAALRRDREGEYVFRIDADGKAQRVPVRGGRRLAGQVEVLEGLDQGDRVVVRGFLGLSSGKVVKIVGGSAEMAEKVEGAPVTPTGSRTNEHTSGQRS